MADYQDDNIITQNWDEHIRMRPGMYIGKLGNGSSFDDGIYVLLKEVIEFYMGKNSPQRQKFIMKNLREEINNFSEES